MQRHKLREWRRLDGFTIAVHVSVASVSAAAVLSVFILNLWAMDLSSLQQVAHSSVPCALAPARFHFVEHGKARNKKMPRVLSVALVVGVSLIGLASLGSAGDGGSPAPEELHTFGPSDNIEGQGFTTGPILQGAEHQHTNQDPPSITASNHRIDDPESGANWILPAALIAGFVAGYGVRSLVSFWRHRRARRLRFGSLTSDRPLEADNSHMSIVPPDEIGDLETARRPRTTVRPRQSS